MVRDISETNYLFKNYLLAIYKVQIPQEREIALIFLKPIELSNEINSERVGKLIIESAKYS